MLRRSYARPADVLTCRQTKRVCCVDHLNPTVLSDIAENAVYFSYSPDHVRHPQTHTDRFRVALRRTRRSGDISSCASHHALASAGPGLLRAIIGAAARVALVPQGIRASPQALARDEKHAATRENRSRRLDRVRWRNLRVLLRRRNRAETRRGRNTIDSDRDRAEHRQHGIGEIAALRLSPVGLIEKTNAPPNWRNSRIRLAMRARMNRNQSICLQMAPSENAPDLTGRGRSLILEHETGLEPATPTLATATAPSNRSMVLFGIQLGASSHPASGPAAERPGVRQQRATPY